MAQAPKGKLVVKNIGLLLSGDLEHPILDADCIVAVDGRIKAVGKAAELDLGELKTPPPGNGRRQPLAEKQIR